MATHTLLIADDSQTVRRIVEMACAGEDVDVVAVAEGEQAIACIAEHPPDIVLADIAMPKGNGYDVAGFVKGRADLAHIPVVLLAGMFEAADHALAMSLGCAEVLVKPLKPQYLMERVRYWLDSLPIANTDAVVIDAVIDAVADAPTAATIDARTDIVTDAATDATADIPADVVLGALAADVVSEVAEASEPDPVGASTSSSEDYFSRLDAAFKSLERPLGSRLGDAVSPLAKGPSTAAGTEAAVPTLQELLDRLPEATRTRLTPAASTGAATPSASPESAVMDTIVTRVLEQLSTRDDLIDEIVRRVTLRQNSERDR